MEQIKPEISRWLSKITPVLTTKKSILARHVIEERMTKQLSFKHLLYLIR